jgi:hypothetical protein
MFWNMPYVAVDAASARTIITAVTCTSRFEAARVPIVIR